MGSEVALGCLCVAEELFTNFDFWSLQKTLLGTWVDGQGTPGDRPGDPRGPQGTARGNSSSQIANIPPAHARPACALLPSAPMTPQCGWVLRSPRAVPASLKSYCRYSKFSTAHPLQHPNYYILKSLGQYRLGARCARALYL